MKVLRDNSLTIVLLLATLGTLTGMLFTGLRVYNDELAEHGGQTVTLAPYLLSGHFLSALFENWESSAARRNQMTPTNLPRKKTLVSTKTIPQHLCP
ncbi:hypothetical protein BHMPCIPO_04739 [Ensifer sesbaniae]|nr:hypothetical protein [Ensifer sesbaniae]